MKSKILTCNQNNIYFLETNEKAKETIVTNIFISNPEEQMPKCKAKRKLKNKFHPTLEFFASNNSKINNNNINNRTETSKRLQGANDKVGNKKCTRQNSSSSSASLEDVVNKSASTSRRNSLEMYEEAANVLGLTCSQTDNCRCIECQCHYFDYNDEIDVDEESDYLVDHDHASASASTSACTIQ